MKTVTCPICSRDVSDQVINEHIDSGCEDHLNLSSSQASSTSFMPLRAAKAIQRKSNGPSSSPMAPIFTQGRKALDSNHSSSTNAHTNKRAVVEDTAIHPHFKRNKIAHLEAVVPLAEKLRPSALCDFVGQSHLTSPGSLLLKTLGGDIAGSIIFWGPPGCGKTTLARLIARQTDCVFKELGATNVGITDVRATLEEAKNTLALSRRKTVLFLDEVHRLTKSQQDICLPYVEQGHVQLVGATTENPSFKLTGALLSRCRVFVLERLTDTEIITILANALKRIGPIPVDSCSTEPGPSSSEPPPFFPSDVIVFTRTYFPQITSKILSRITSLAAGDARAAISLLELAIQSPKDSKEESLLAALKHSVSASYDRTGESHYDMISALHKSVRGSQGSAALYWLARLLTAGEDPLYIARRMVVCASEDIGLADNNALPLAMATLQACQTIGMPECRINLAHLVAYLAEAPKSTRAYEAYNRAEAAAKLDLTIPVPMSMRNAPTELMKDLGYGKTYLYNPSYAHPVHNIYLPIQFEGEVFLRREGDTRDKIWDEAALCVWEHEANGDKEWEGRPAVSGPCV
ncbi:ATPase WRNIP1 [Termitomyces sp. T112]|nr:ATPase WRNIP1 [Termitomyces sp. T112]